MKKCEEFFRNNKPKFLFGITDIRQLKEKNDVMDVAFIGKSNVGKSSLINAITNSKISISSKTAGRTREINFFAIGDRLNFVDMPGYSFALASEEQREKWKNLICDYFAISKNLKLVFLLVDCKKGLKGDDLDFMNMLDDLKISYQIILTKIDSINRFELDNVVIGVENELKNHSLANENVLAVSSTKKYGIFEVMDRVWELLKNN